MPPAPPQHRPPGGRRARRGGRRALVAALAATAAGCSGGPRFGMPDAASEQGGAILDLWRGAAWAALAVGALVWGLIVWSVVRYRRRNDDLPSQTPDNIPLELFYVAVPLVVVAVLFGFTVATEVEVTDLADDPDHVVEVVGFQWSWRFAYPEDGVVVEADGRIPPTLALPVGETTRVELVAADVNHSFWLPEQLVKKDMIQGLDNEVDVTPTRTGSWTGRCSEFCGLDHHEMVFELLVLEPDAFEDWLDDRRAEQRADELDDEGIDS